MVNSCRRMSLNKKLRRLQCTARIPFRSRMEMRYRGVNLQPTTLWTLLLCPAINHILIKIDVRSTHHLLITTKLLITVPVGSGCWFSANNDRTAVPEKVPNITLSR